MTRFVLDAGALLHVVSADVAVAASHKLLAPTLIRSQTLSALHESVAAGRLDPSTRNSLPGPEPLCVSLRSTT
ncbi:hypothetical protein [Mycetocola miduiensis]|uniref:PIN domain-containing protein n=1 Tax=Mycetocola miduiensis TaxID=995034 RepID=A0A1I4ZFD9_9MICO|nr:hypothetical protein [Mycetocola miduiensis]SFN48699.1 hypothetical protein SAMN05216219_0757 [Mycetocola miduiensis]